MTAPLNLAGRRFGKLTAVERVGTGEGRSALWLCKCDCGNTKEITCRALTSGNTRSCGCLVRETGHRLLFRHGMKRTKIYSVFHDMKHRCNNPKDNRYQCYGGRGIKVCDEWNGEHGFETFYKWAIENGYHESQRRGDCTIDRIDVDKDYSPENCRWVDNWTQANNKRTNIFVECEGETHTIAEWSRLLGVKYHTLYTRIRKKSQKERERIINEYRNKTGC